MQNTFAAISRTSQSRSKRPTLSDTAFSVTERVRYSVIGVFSILSLLGSGWGSAAENRTNLRISAGSSWQSRNDVQIPNTNLGTRFSLYDTAGAGPVPAVRIEFNRMLNEQHGIRMLLAPLSYTDSVTFDQQSQFAGESFNADQALDATYRFNSWRVGYHYTPIQSGAFRWRIGGTLKVRDAEIRLEQGNTVAFDDNVGVVPLLYLAATYRLNNQWTLGADLDGLAGGPGRAIDLGFTVDYSINQRWKIGADLRLLDGGADTDEVYNFARFSTAAIAISTAF